MTNTDSTTSTDTPAAAERDARGKFTPGNAAGRGPRRDQIAAKALGRALLARGLPWEWAFAKRRELRAARELLAGAALWTNEERAARAAEIDAASATCIAAQRAIDEAAARSAT